MNYFQKYVKYKNKYLQLKSQIGGSDDANVLIVVDVQNCFINGGSFGGDTKNKQLVDEVTKLVNNGNFDYIVLTRDMHPAHHSSHMLTSSKGKIVVKNKLTGKIEERTEQEAFLSSIGFGDNDIEPLGGPWPPHCRVTRDDVKNAGKCATRTHENDTWDSNELTREDRAESNGKKIIGNHIAHYYNHEHPIIKHFYNPDMKLGIKDVDGEQNKNPSEVSYILNVLTNMETIKKEKRPPILQVFKGQLCNWDAYSAFQYHANFEVHPLMNDVNGNLDHTTCLAEVLFSNEYGLSQVVPEFKNVNIVVCGLVGEVCVKYTVSYGLNLIGLAKENGGLKGYDRLNTITGEKLTSSTIPNINFIYSSYATRFIPNPILINNIDNEIEQRVNELSRPLDELHMSYNLFLNKEEACKPDFFPTDDDMKNVLKIINSKHLHLGAGNNTNKLF
jgi:nicotinamidase-related amidase